MIIDQAEINWNERRPSELPAPSEVVYASVRRLNHDQLSCLLAMSVAGHVCFNEFWDELSDTSWRLYGCVEEDEFSLAVSRLTQRQLCEIVREAADEEWLDWSENQESQ